MKKLVKMILSISNKEDYRGKFWIINIGILLFFILLFRRNSFNTTAYGYVMLNMWIAVISNSLFSLFDRHRIENLWILSSLSEFEQIIALSASVLVQTLPSLLMNFACFYQLGGKHIASVLLLALSHTLFSITLGSFLGRICKREYAGTILIVLFYLTICLTKVSSWIGAESTRLYSPVVQLMNVRKINLSNLYSLLGISLLMYVLCFTGRAYCRKGFRLIVSGFIVVSTVLICFVIIKEQSFNRLVRSNDFVEMYGEDINIYYRGLDDTVSESYKEMVCDIEEELLNRGIINDRSQTLIIQKYFVAPSYLPYLKERWVPFEKKGSIMNINIISDAMLNQYTPELYYNMFERILFTCLLQSGKEEMDYKDSVEFLATVILGEENKYPVSLCNFVTKKTKSVGINILGERQNYE